MERFMFYWLQCVDQAHAVIMMIMFLLQIQHCSINQHKVRQEEPFKLDIT